MAKKSEMKTCTIGKYKNCVVMESGILKLAVSTDFGPRVLGCFIGDDDNMMVVMPNRALKGCNTGFRLYGGHRLWHSPEAKPRSYEPDNDPVDVTQLPNGYEFACPSPEAETGIRKSIQIEALSNGVFQLTHCLENCGMWDVELAPWALTMMAPGGTAIIPQNTNPTGYPFAPDRSLVLWPYSSLTDPRLSFGREYVFLRQDPSLDYPCKIGFNDAAGWLAYARNGKALVKYFDYQEDCEYPDFGCSVESYTCTDFLEAETVAPLEVLQPGESVEHVEYWQGIAGLPALDSDEAVKKYLEPQLLICEDDECEDDECCCGGDESHCHHRR